MDTMETITVKYNVVNTALMRLKQSLEYFDMAKEAHKKSQLKDADDIAYTVARDSIIQRFEFSVELFWKYLRIYLETHEKVLIELNTPRAVIRSATQARILSEQEAIDCINMIEGRNLTSHMYKEEVAEQLAHDIPQYYQQMRDLLGRLKP
jgi:nucleotidyltransferase substrate binding protein (TIGR01987 family)